MKITLENIARLERNSQLMYLYDNSYLRNVDNENFKYIKDKFFRHESIDTAKLLNSGVGLFTTIPNVVSSYVSNPESQQKVEIIQSTRDLETLGFSVVGLETVIKDGKPQAQTAPMPSEGYFIQDGVQYIARTYAVQKTMNVEYYILLQSFYEDRTENHLYRMNTSILTNTELPEVKLNAIEDTAGMQEVMYHNFGRPAIFVVQEDSLDTYPTNSEIEKIKNQVYAMDRKKVMFDCEFLKNVESFLLVKGINLSSKVLAKYEKGSIIDFSDLGRIVHGGPESSMEFIKNTNDLIKDAIESQKDDMRLVSTLTNIPLDFLGMDTAHGSLGKGSRSLLHGSFVKKIEYIRSIWDRFLPEIMETLEAINGGESSYSRPDVYAQNDGDLLDELVVAKQNKLISQQKAMMLYMGYKEEEAQEEIEKINNESLPTDSTIDEDTNNGSNETDEGAGARSV